MLNDVFENRYIGRPIWQTLGPPERRLLIQCGNMIVKQIFPVWTWDGKAEEKNSKTLQLVLDVVANEVGLREFHSKYYTVTTKWNGSDITNSHKYTMDFVYNWIFGAELGPSKDADSWIKRCLSIVEMAFRYKNNEINAENLKYPKELAAAELQDKLPSASRGIRVPGKRVDSVKAINANLNAWFKANVDELNTRFEQAGAPLSYHNGFIQFKTDQLTSDTIEKPFWSLVSGPEWSNVDIDMKSALDLRDTGGRDPAFYAARSLESTIKIISGKTSRTIGNEKGAANYIDNLIRDNGGRFIEVWEGDNLKSFFSKIRNPLTHGPGEGEIMQLTNYQTDWAIEYCMSWIKSLIKRMPN